MNQFGLNNNNNNDNNNNSTIIPTLASSVVYIDRLIALVNIGNKSNQHRSKMRDNAGDSKISTNAADVIKLFEQLDMIKSREVIYVIQVHLWPFNFINGYC
jgi:hypothetical protein